MNAMTIYIDTMQRSNRSMSVLTHVNHFRFAFQWKTDELRYGPRKLYI